MYHELISVLLVLEENRRDLFFVPHVPGLLEISVDALYHFLSKQFYGQFSFASRFSGGSVHNKSCDESIFCEADVRAAQTKMATHVVGDKAQAKSTESKILPNNEGKRAEKRKSEKVKDSSKMHDTLRAMLDQVLQNQNTFNKSIGDLGNKVKVL